MEKVVLYPKIQTQWSTAHTEVIKIKWFLYIWNSSSENQLTKMEIKWNILWKITKLLHLGRNIEWWTKRWTTHSLLKNEFSTSISLLSLNCTISEKATFLKNIGTTFDLLAKIQLFKTFYLLMFLYYGKFKCQAHNIAIILPISNFYLILFKVPYKESLLIILTYKWI